MPDDRPAPPPSRARALSGMRPTGALHLGHYHGALKNWLKLQTMHDCFFFVADWHALTTSQQDHQIYSDASTRDGACQGCKSAAIGCLDSKQPLIEAIIKEQAPWRARAEELLAHPKQVQWIVEVGTERARAVARKTLREVRSAMGLSY